MREYHVEISLHDPIPQELFEFHMKAENEEEAHDQLWEKVKSHLHITHTEIAEEAK